MNKKKLKRVIFVLAIAAVLIITAQIIKSLQPEPEIVIPVRPAKVMELTENQGSFTRRYPGQVKASRTVDMTFEVMGQVVELAVAEGSQVEQGDLLARLDPQDYQNRRDAIRAQYDTAKSNMERAKILFEKNMISQVEMESKQAEYDVRLADYNIAQKALNDTYMYAPFSGIIANRSVELYEQVQARQPIMTLEDLREIDIDINIPENTVRIFDQYKINVYARFDRGPEDSYPLKVKEFSTTPDVQTKTYKATMTMERPNDFPVFPGMSVNVILNAELKDEMEKGNFVVPVSSVFSDESGQSRVWIVNTEAMTVHARPVTTDSLTADTVELAGGVQPGEIIVTAGVSQLMEGQKIRFFE